MKSTKLGLANDGLLVDEIAHIIKVGTNTMGWRNYKAEAEEIQRRFVEQACEALNNADMSDGARMISEHTIREKFK